MNNAADLLTPKDRRILAGLGAVCLLAILFLVLGGLGQRRGARTRLESLAAAQNETRLAEAARDSARTEWQSWEDARLDLAGLRRDYFYRRADGIARLRLDLQKIFNSLGLAPADVKFDYTDYDKEAAQKVTVTFTFSGSYGLLRRFLFAVEKFPKLLFAERVDFLSIETRSGALNLKIALTAYYEL